MSPLKLFTAFHANLDFSAMPEADRPRVIASCYWPLLSLPEEYGIRIGFEASARTLSILEREDPEWVKRFQSLAEHGLVEPLASGWAQVVAPLAPVEVNRANLALGNTVYERILGRVPETFYANEQTWSDSLTSLYQEAGARRVVMEWNNAASRRPELRPLRCRPARLASGQASEKAGPVVLWNDSIVFQKMQRVAHGEIPFAELGGLLDRLVAKPHAEALCLYGGDVEIFDYRPSRAVPMASRTGQASEMRRLLETFREVARDPRFEFVLPREVAPCEEQRVEADRPAGGRLAVAVELPEVRLGSAVEPIVCKKQPRYNPTRWAVSGRDGFGMNTRCHEVLRLGRAMGRLEAPSPERSEALDRALVDLWRSDFRTRATEEKLVEFEAGAGAARSEIGGRLELGMPALSEGEDVLLLNPGDSEWLGSPVELPLELRAGQAFALEVGVRGGPALGRNQWQVEVLGRHRDSSIRRARLIVSAPIPARGRLALTLVPVADRESRAEASAPDSDAGSFTGGFGLDTRRVEARFLTHRGAAIESLRFPGLTAEGPDAPLLGTIPHGFFDAIEYTPDFYSGHVVAETEQGAKRTNLAATELALVPEASGAIRATLAATVETPLGPWRTIYRVYHDRPRLDVVHDLAFHDARLAGLRLGLCTLRPEGWDRDHLRYGTTQGGDTAEWYDLEAGLRVHHSKAVSSSVSASSCLGATEGWVAIEDARQGLLIQGDRDQAAVVPMLDFEEVDESFFLRLSHSAAETDETRASFLRGRRCFGFSIEGYRVGAFDVAGAARQRHEGLLYRTETEVGLTRGV